MSNVISRNWTKIQDGIRFMIDDGGCLWVDATEGHRTGFLSEGEKKIGIYLTKEQLEEMNLYRNEQ